MAGDRDRRASSIGPGRGVLALAAALLLAGCDALPDLGDALPVLGEADGAAPAAGAPAPRATTDVEAPEVFRAAEPGLWDGRPSLGGVWVAHPDVADPERVRIVNAANGQEVVGALFRRERDLPGPALQVSSDAAAALGMLAGAPTPLRVTALRREEAPAARDSAPSGAPTEAPAVAGAVASPQVAAAPAAAGPASGEAVARATAAILAGAASAPSPGAIATTALDAPGATGAAGSPLISPFVQLATFGSEANAQDAARSLASRGLPARVTAGQGQAPWRLLLGPATTEAEQTALLARAVAEGFADAYLVRR